MKETSKGKRNSTHSAAGYDERWIWELILFILAPIVSGVVLHILSLLPLPFVIITSMLMAILIALPLLYSRLKRDLWSDLRGLEKRFHEVLRITKMGIDALISMRTRLSKLRREEAITVGVLVDILDEATSAISREVMNAYFKGLGVRLGNPNYEESRKRELLEKALRREINEEEGEELRKLLERQKQEREAAGDLLGAIMLGLLILFIIGVLAALFGERR